MTDQAISIGTGQLLRALIYTRVSKDMGKTGRSVDQ
ncbi:MAG: hypothetical protein JWN00_749, partial [Actinomycetia bacterium]|nr:hypothetical protein [Actinomycetes bacterium]